MAVEWTPGDYFSLICVIILFMFGVFYCIKNGENNRNRKIQPGIVYEEKAPEEQKTLLKSENLEF